VMARKDVHTTFLISDALTSLKNHVGSRRSHHWPISAEPEKY
jgi:hypothetical protein